jgi:dGTP triphosphohydrolase
MLSLRSFMFARVYQQQEHTHVTVTVRRIFDDLTAKGYSLEDATDYLAGMTDRFALAYEAA